MDIQPALSRNTFSNLPPEKQDKIVAAAVSEFARQGYRKASMNTIVREAGIAKGSLYQYFRNKEVLFFFIFDRFTLLVKKTVAEQERSIEAETEAEDDFFLRVRNVLLAGIAFIDLYPEYFQIYLKVLFEQDVPRREELLSQVRLFSWEYFGPLCQLGQKSGAIRRDVPLDVVIFVLDATLDRFLQSYARSYPDCGMGLAKLGGTELLGRVNMILRVLREGLTGSGLHTINHDV